jgi:dolichol-phosphate mannosyltransferase
MRNKIKKIIGSHETLAKFLIVGLSGIIVNMFFLWFFKSIINFDLRIAGVFAIEISVINNFIFNDIWTFKDRKNSSVLAKFLKYNLSVLLGLLLNYASLLLLTKYGIYYLLANLIGIILSTTTNYILSSRWAWKH